MPYGNAAVLPTRRWACHFYASPELSHLGPARSVEENRDLVRPEPEVAAKAALGPPPSSLLIG